MANRLEGDFTATGRWRFTDDVSLPAGTIGDDDVDATDPLAVDKVQHQYEPTYAQPNTTATAVTQAIHEVFGATGTIVGFRAGSIVACVGGATITVDLKKNGTTVLSGVITLDNANTAYVSEAGTLSVTTLVAGDVLTIVTTATSGGGTIGTGLWAQVVLKEAAT